MSNALEVSCYASSEEALQELGACFAPLAGSQLLLTLSGDLGAGKTTLVRGILRGTGYDGPVKSPTFSLVEPYELPSGNIFHFDLYRLNNAEELEFIGMREYLAAKALCVVEWPEKAANFLPIADIHITITRTEKGRKVMIRTQTVRGNELFQQVSVSSCWSAFRDNNSG